MVEDLLKAGHLKQYVRTAPKGEGSSHGRGPRAPTTPVRAVINYIYGGPLDDEYSSKRKKVETAASSHGSGTHKLHPAGISQWGHPPHRRNHCFPCCESSLSTAATSRCSCPNNKGGRLRCEKNPGRPRQLADLLQVAVIKQMGFEPSNMENPGRTLFGFNGSSTTSLGDVTLSIQAGPVILNVLFSVVEDVSPFNAILGRM